MYEIIPALLEKEWTEIEKKINLVKPFARTIHIDIIDGKFAPDTTFLDPKPFAQYSKGVFLEAHLMVEEPLQYLKPFADAGFKRFLGHVEKMSDKIEFVAQGQILGEVGLAIDSPSAIDTLGVPFDDLDCLLVMAVKAGAAQQSFMPEMLQKVKDLRLKTELPIEVDGGINDTTIIQAKDAGATRFMVNSFLFQNENPSTQYHILEQLLNNQSNQGESSIA